MSGDVLTCLLLACRLPVTQQGLILQCQVPFEYADRRVGDVAACYADVSLAGEELRWTAKRGLDEMCTFGQAVCCPCLSVCECDRWWWWWCRPHPVREHAQDLRPPLGARPASPTHVKQRSHPHRICQQIPDR